MLPLRKDAITPPPLWRFHPFLTLNPSPSQVQLWSPDWVWSINALISTLSPHHISVWRTKGVHLYIFVREHLCVCVFVHTSVYTHREMEPLILNPQNYEKQMTSETKWRLNIATSFIKFLRGFKLMQCSLNFMPYISSPGTRPFY